MSFEEFKASFQKWADDLITKWSSEKWVSKPSLHILPDEKLDPWRAGPHFITYGWKAHGIEGPAIIFPERYLSSLYTGGVRREAFSETWNTLLYTLAHESGHNITDSIRPIFFSFERPHRIPLGEVVRRGEIAASVRATITTGKTRLRANTDFLKVTGRTKHRYYLERYVDHELKERAM